MNRLGWIRVVLALFFGMPIQGAFATTFSRQILMDGQMTDRFQFVYADLNGDQRQDLVLSDSSEAQFFWLERCDTIKPRFTRHAVKTPHSYGGYISLGDLDADGDLDIVSTGIEDQPGGEWYLLWRENDGSSSPSFTTHILDNDHVYRRTNLVVDIDSDGDADILCATRYWGARIHLYLNTGSKPPAFTKHVVYEIPSLGGSQPQIQDLEIIDFDRDGHLDIISVDSPDEYADFGGHIHWLRNLNTDPPSFQVHQLYQNAWFGYDVNEGDFDQDGDPDLVASFLDGYVVWFENVYPSDPAVIPHRFETTDRDPLSVVVADTDLDGDLDFFVLHGNGETIYFYENDAGFPSRFSASLFDRVYRPYHMVPSDLDGDGDLDLISLSGDSFWYENLLVQEPSVIDVDPLIGFDSFGREGGAFYPDRFQYVVGNHSTTQSLQWSVQPNVQWVTVEPSSGLLGPESETTVTVSFNDFTRDLLSGNYTATLDFNQVGVGRTVAALEIALRIISRCFRFLQCPYRIASTSAFTYNFTIADLNGDGAKDILCTRWGGSELFWVRRTPGTPNRFNTITLRPGIHEDLAAVFSVGDLDGDGDLDLLTISYTGLVQSLDWHENDGADHPQFQSHPVAPDFLYGREPAIVDVDGDGDNDIIAASAHTRAIYWFENDGNPDPGFSRRLLSSDATGENVYESIPVDLDLDGDTDLVTRTDDPWKVSWIEQLSGGTPTFESHLLPVQNGYFPNGMTTEDFNGDGRPDIVVTYVNDLGQQAGRIIVFENHLGDTLPHFAPKVIDESIISPYKANAGDFDGDGDVDLFVLDVWQDEDKIYYMENQNPASYAFATVLFWTVYRPRHICMDDIDQDGDQDILLHDLSSILLFEYEEYQRTAARTWLSYK